MKKIIVLLILLLAMCKPCSVFSQDVKMDTANYPYWIGMMQDPHANFFRTQRAFNTYWKNRKITKGCGWKVFKRWEYMMQSRVNPDGSYPEPDATFNAYAAYRSAPHSQIGNWVSLGPSHIPAPGPGGYEGLGRLNTVAFHPTDSNKFYVGSPSGGFWYTSDGGTTWNTSTDTLPTLGVSAIIVDYSNPNKILIGTGDRDAGDASGLGVFKSTDGGLSWYPSKTGMSNVMVGNMLQHPTNSQIFLAATSGGVFRSADGGANWTKTKSGNFKDIKFKPGDPNTVYAAINASFYKSTDNGITFTQITSGLPSGQQRGVIAVTAANSNYVYFLVSDNSSGFQGLYRSTNSGLSFNTRSTSPNILDWSCDGSGTGGQGWYDLALVANPTNAEMIYVGGVDVWKSTNGGTSWTINSHWYGGCSVPAVHADCHYLAYSPVNSNLYACNDGGIFGTNNGGNTWTYYTETMTIGQIYKLGQSQTVRDEVINGFQDNGTYTYLPGGWVATGGGDGMECAVDYTNAAYTYYTLYYGDIFRRYNNNNEAHIAGNGVNGITESGAWVTPFVMGKSNHKQMFAGYINIWRCNNVMSGGITWQKISDNLAGSNSNDMAVLEQSGADTNILYAARSDNKLFRSDNCLDANPVWIDITSHLPAQVTATSIATHPAEPNTVYLTAGTKVYKSSNKGFSWTDITGNLPSVHISSIVYYKNAYEGLYVGTDAGVYYRDHFTDGWIPFTQGLPANGRITELEIYYDNDSISQDVIRASSYGRGLWGSDMYHAPVTADFSADHTLIPVGCAINFTDLSSGVPSSWQWTFTGATPNSSNVKNPSSITYNTAGTYPVKLKCWNEFSQDSITKASYITVSSTLLPLVDFTADKQSLCIGDTVHFTDLTQNCPNAWAWQFTPNTVTYINGTTNNSENPVVIFNDLGSYDVTLYAANNVGQSSLTKPAYILYGGYPLTFLEDFKTGFGTHFWTVVNPDQDMTWDTITAAGASGKAAWMNFFNYPVVNRRDQLISPPLRMPAAPPIELTFRHAYAQRDIVKDSLIIKISEDCGNTWTRLWAMGPNGTPSVFVTAPPDNNSFYPQSAGQWCSGSYGVGCYSVNLADYAGMSNVKLMFEAFNRNGNNLFLTDIMVSGEVGINNKPLDMDGILIYPNPSKGLFTLECRQCKGNMHLSVISQDGLEMYVHDIPASIQPVKEVIDLRQLSKGIYFIRVTNNQQTHVGKLILN
jgi:PKD repeat protein